MSVTISLSLPRCRSVMILQSVFAAGSYDICLHEPTIRPYDTIHFSVITADWFIDGFVDFTHLETYLENNVKQGKHIFIKDMVFSCAEWLTTTQLWERIGEPTILLWLRNPCDGLISFFRMSQDISDERIVDQLCNYESMLKLRNELGFRIHILDSDTLVSQPAEYLAMIAKRLDRPVFGNTTWQPLTHAQMVEHWKEGKRIDLVTRWHGDALTSAGFKANYHRTDVPDILPTIDGVKNKTYLQQVYSRSLQAYRMLLANKD